MSIGHKLLGNTVQLSIDEVVKQVGNVFINREEVRLAFKLFRDMYIFRNCRLILVDKQVLTRKKVEYLTIPYRSSSSFAVETAGTFDADAELKIWVSGQEAPVCKKLKKGTDVVGLQRMLAESLM